MITLAVPTYRRFDLLTGCVWSALAGAVRPDRVVVVDNSGGACPAIPGAEVVLGRQPQSVAAAWNDAARLAGGDWLILANDDVVFAPDTVAELLRVAQSDPTAGIISPLGGERFALFLLRWAAYQEVGPFDEGFAPAYFEDNDYAWRLRVAGWTLGDAPSHVRHGGSRTIATYAGDRLEAHHRSHRANEARYVAKWGGMPGDERWRVPYGR